MSQVLFHRIERNFHDVRNRIIRFKCGHIEEIHIFGNPIEKIASDLQDSFCRKCGSFSTHIYPNVNTKG